MNKIIKKMFEYNVEPYRIKWYPNLRSCIVGGKKQENRNQMPPLMVRRAEWRN